MRTGERGTAGAAPAGAPLACSPEEDGAFGLAAGVPDWRGPEALDPATGRRDATVVAVAEPAVVAAPAPGLPVAGPDAAAAVPAPLEGAEATVES
jgi:hypothetical protein